MATTCQTLAVKYSDFFFFFSRYCNQKAPYYAAKLLPLNVSRAAVTSVSRLRNGKFKPLRLAAARFFANLGGSVNTFPKRFQTSLFTFAGKRTQELLSWYQRRLFNRAEWKTVGLPLWGRGVSGGMAAGEE